MYLKKLRLAGSILLVSSLLACGGGGGGDSSSGSGNTGGNTGNTGGNTGGSNGGTDTPTTPGVELKNDVTAYCSLSDAGCGSLNHFTYTGSGTGIWSYFNNTNQPQTIEFNIKGVNNKQITKSIVNMSNNSVNLDTNPFLSTSSSTPLLSQQLSVDAVAKTLSKKDLMAKRIHDMLVEQENSISKKTREFVPSKSQSQSRMLSMAPQFNVVGDKKTFSKLDASSSSSSYSPAGFTLVSVDNLYDGRKLNIWVEDTEYTSGKIYSSDVNNLKSHFLKVYQKAVELNGSPYDATISVKYPYFIPDSPLQPINVMLSNIIPDGEGFGTLGYFAPIHNNLKSIYGSSNEALQIFVDTETIYQPYGLPLDINNPEDQQVRAKSSDFIKSVLSHEFTHLILFTQRNIISLIPTTSVFANESFASAAEDILRTSGEINSDSFLENRAFFYSLSHGSSCAINDWNCTNAYERSSVLMAYLVRKYGVPFYMDLIKNTNLDDITLFDQTIKKFGGESFADELFYMQALRSGLNGASATKGFDLPAVTSGGFTLKSYNNAFPASNNLSKPAKLSGLGASWFTTNTGSNPQGKVIVPPDSSFMLVVK